MALIPGGRINGKFKTFREMTTEELEQLVIESKIKSLLVCMAVGIFVGLAALVFIGG